MHLVVVIIQPFKLDEVRRSLLEAGVSGMTVSHVDGFGNQKGLTPRYRGQESSVVMHPKIKIEVAVSAEQLDGIVEAIKAAASTGEIGDGKIFVMPLQQIVRIRTGDRDVEAL